MTTKTLNIKSIMRAFGVSHMTVHTWRKGSVTKDPLPVIENESREVAFKPADVKRWAKTHGVEVVDAAALVPGDVAAVRPGPKAKAVVKKSALRVKQVSKKTAPRKLAKVVARAMKPLPRPGEAGYVEPVRTPVARASSVDKAVGRVRGHMAI